MRPPLFVGGSGRSGTTPTARLLGSHSALATFPSELRVHVQPNGLVDLMLGRVSFDAFATRCRGRWYRRPDPGGVSKWRTEAGLFQFTSEEGIETLLARLESRLAEDRPAAIREFISGILDPAAVAAGKVGWVEHSPENVTIAAALHAMYPNLRFIHSMRDGRDVAASIMQVRWGPDNIPEAIRWWGHRMRTAHRQLAGIPGDQVLVLRVEGLVGADRGDYLAELLTFAGVGPEPALLAYFDEEVTAPKAHIGRWRQQVDLGSQPEIDALYAAVIESLRADGVPLPIDAPQGGAPAGVAAQLRYEAVHDLKAATALVERLRPLAVGPEGQQALAAAEADVTRLEDQLRALG